MTKMMDVDNLLTGPEVAYLANQTKLGTFERWKIDTPARGDTPARPKVLPDPDWYFGLTPVWDLTKTLIPWLEATNRRYDVDAWRKAKADGQFRRKSPANAKAS